MIEHYKSEKVKHDIEEGKQAKHPPEFDKIIPTGDLAQGRYAQARQQKDQRPGAGKASDEFNGIGREIIGESIVKQLAEREQVAAEVVVYSPDAEPFAMVVAGQKLVREPAPRSGGSGGR